jgi:hypothetical protein
MHWKQKAVSFIGYTLSGILFVGVSGVVLGIFASALRFQDGQSAFALTTITQMTTAFVNLEPLGIIIGLGSFFLLGLLIWLFGILGVEIRKKLGTKDGEIKFDKRPFILAFVIAGVITVVVFAGLQAILVGITNDPTVDLTSVTTLYDAIATGNPLLFTGAFIGLTIIGFLVIAIAKVERKVGEEVLPKEIQY